MNTKMTPGVRRKVFARGINGNVDTYASNSSAAKSLGVSATSLALRLKTHNVAVVKDHYVGYTKSTVMSYVPNMVDLYKWGTFIATGGEWGEEVMEYKKFNDLLNSPLQPYSIYLLRKYLKESCGCLPNGATIQFKLIGRIYRLNGFEGHRLTRPIYSYDIITGTSHRYPSMIEMRREVGSSNTAISSRCNSDDITAIRPHHRVSFSDDIDLDKEITFKELRTLANMKLIVSGSVKEESTKWRDFYASPWFYKTSLVSKLSSDPDEAMVELARLGAHLEFQLGAQAYEVRGCISGRPAIRRI